MDVLACRSYSRSATLTSFSFVVPSWYLRGTFVGNLNVSTNTQPMKASEGALESSVRVVNGLGAGWARGGVSEREITAPCCPTCAFNPHFARTGRPADLPDLPKVRWNPPEAAGPMPSSTPRGFQRDLIYLLYWAKYEARCDRRTATKRSEDEGQWLRHAPLKRKTQIAS